LLLKDIYTFIEDQNVASASTETEIPLDSHFGGRMRNYISFTLIFSN